MTSQVKDLSFIVREAINRKRNINASILEPKAKAYIEFAKKLTWAINTKLSVKLHPFQFPMFRARSRKINYELGFFHTYFKNRWPYKIKEN